VTDWLQDPYLSDAEKIARYEALTEGGVVLFADPLAVTVSDAIVVDHPPLGQASVSRLLDNVVGATMPEKVELIVGDGHIDADRLVAPRS